MSFLAQILAYVTKNKMEVASLAVDEDINIEVNIITEEIDTEINKGKSNTKVSPITVAEVDTDVNKKKNK